VVVKLQANYLEFDTVIICQKYAFKKINKKLTRPTVVSVSER